MIWGEEDGVVTIDYGRRYAEAIPGARFETIAGAGHHPELESPEAFAEILGSFIQNREKRP